LDLAISQNASGDDTVLLSIDRVMNDTSLFKQGDVIIRNIERGKFLPNETREKVITHNKVVQPMSIRVESNGYQEMMARDLNDNGIRITSYHTGGEKNDPDVGVNSLSVLLSQGKLILPNSADPRTRKLVTQLVNEMRAYPDGHTGDALMALWFAYSELRDNLANQLVIPRPYVVPEPEVSDEAADRQAITQQELVRSGNDPKLRMKQLVEQGQQQAREYWRKEEEGVFRKMMRR